MQPRMAATIWASAERRLVPASGLVSAPSSEVTISSDAIVRLPRYPAGATSGQSILASEVRIAALHPKIINPDPYNRTECN